MGEFKFTCPRCGSHRFSAHDAVVCNGDNCRFSAVYKDAWRYCGFKSAAEARREWGW